VFEQRTQEWRIKNNWNGMEWNGMEWNGMEWNGMEWNGMEWNQRSGTNKNIHCCITEWR